MGCCLSSDIIKNIENRFKQTEDDLPFKEIPCFILLKSYKIHAVDGKLTIDNIRQAFGRSKIEPSFAENKRFREMLKRILTGNQVSCVKLYCLSLLSSHGKNTEKAGLVWDILYELCLNGEMLVNELANIAIAMIWLSDNLNHAVLFRHEQRLNEGIDNLTRRASFSFPSLDGTSKGKEKFIQQLTTHETWKLIFSASSIRNLLYIESRMPYKPSLSSLFNKDKVITCNQGHTLLSKDLNPARFNDDSYSIDIKCSVCTTEIESRAWGCSECSYFLCSNCRQWVLNTIEYTDSNLRCGNGHTLRVTPTNNQLYGSINTSKFCTACNGEIVKDSLYCMACNFDICWSCTEKLEEVLKRRKVPKCSVGHEMIWRNEIRGEDELTEFRCKKCRSVKNVGVSGFYCEKCKIGVCLNCADNAVLSRVI